MKLKTKFQDEDFELGEVVNANIFYSGDTRQGFKVVAVAKAGGECSFYYNSIKDFTDHWEDVEEPKGSALLWMVLALENFIENEPDDTWVNLDDCKQMLEKLKAWGRLEDKGFRFEQVGRYEDLCGNGFNIPITATMPPEAYTDVGVSKDLDLLFGGEE